MNCLTKIRCVFLLFCFTHGSVVLGDLITECEDDVYELFDSDNSPEKNFLHAFGNYNLVFFYNYYTTTRPNKIKYALGYFEDLLKPIGENFDQGFSTMEFCNVEDEYEKKLRQETLWVLFGKRHLNHDEEITRILNMTRAEAFKFVYLNRNYPQHDNPHPQDYSQEGDYELINAIEQSLGKSHLDLQICRLIKEYIEWLILNVKSVARHRVFRNVKEYCVAEALKLNMRKPTNEE